MRPPSRNRDASPSTTAPHLRRAPRRGLAWALALLAAAPAAATLAAGDAQAAPFAYALQDTGDRLPETRYAAATAWTGADVFLLGGALHGAGPWRDSILRYNPLTHASEVMGARLPNPRYGAAAAWDGANIYVFGGHNATGGGQVVRYNPATDRAEALGSFQDYGFPNVAYLSAVAVGPSIYLLGGCNQPFFTREVLRYTPAINRMDKVAELPLRSCYSGTAFDGTHVYLFGGHSPDTSTVYHPFIQRFTPATGETALLPTTLPTGRFGAVAMAMGRDILVMGGWDVRHATDAYRYDQAADRLERLPWSPPGGRFYAGTAFDGARGYLLGGSTPTGVQAQILRVDRSADLALARQEQAVGVTPQATPAVIPQGTPEIATPATCTAAPCAAPTPYNLGAVSTPGVGPVGASTPGAPLPATCTLGPCYAPTNLPDEVVTIPGIGPWSTSTPAATVPRVCSPTLCVGPAQVSPQGVPLLPVRIPYTRVTNPHDAPAVCSTAVGVACRSDLSVPAQQVGPTPSVHSRAVVLPSGSVDPVCATAGVACLGPVSLLPSQGSPGGFSQLVTPGVRVEVERRGLGAWAAPDLGRTSWLESLPVVVEVPRVLRVPVDLCPQRCLVPVAGASGGAQLDFLVVVTVGDARHEVPLPVRVQLPP